MRKTKLITSVNRISIRPNKIIVTKLCLPKLYCTLQSIFHNSKVYNISKL